MGIEALWLESTTLEREVFQRICRKLLKSTFIVRDKDEEGKKAYFFVLKNRDLFSEYLSYIGFDVHIDRDHGVVILQNYANGNTNNKVSGNRLVFKKIESIILCALWTLLSEKIRSGSLSRTIVVSMIDLKFELERYKMKDRVDKSTLNNTFALFTKYSLIEVSGVVGDEDCKIKLYPSLLFALDVDGFCNFQKSVEKRMIDNQKENVQVEEVEEDDIEENGY